jgi:hypothetical protein
MKIELINEAAENYFNMTKFCFANVSLVVAYYGYGSIVAKISKTPDEAPGARLYVFRHRAAARANPDLKPKT